MDPVRAERISRELVGQLVDEWLIHRYVGAGKSAVVFEGEKNGQKAALKVFDPELVDRFGKETQLRRIDRELSLIGVAHPNLVRIFAGGECHTSGYLYVAMEFIDAPNLERSLTLVPRDKIVSIIHQIASAASFLEQMGLVHRDIKPENIAVFPDFSRTVVLDLGVLRPFGDPSLTDENARTFIGTLRYSSPEFLLRTESDTLEGWRAVTFYQIGAVMHDLIMRRPLFKEFSEPFAMLVEAVKSERPEIHADDVSADLVLLAQNCLVKSPEARLSLVTWSDFEFVASERRPSDSARGRVKKRTLLSRAHSVDGELHTQQTPRQIAKLVFERLDSIIRNECAGNSSFPPIEITNSNNNEIKVRVLFATSLDHGLPNNLSIEFNCTILDISTMAISILVSCCLQLTAGEHNNPDHPVNMFRGPLDSSSLTSRVQDILWCSIDKAQRISANLSTDSGTVWLDLSGELEVGL